MKIAIIGAGISGISLACMLQEQNIHSILYEAKAKPGGLIACDWIDGNLFHKVGGHVFNSKNQQVLDWFWKHFDREQEFIPTRRNAKILLENQIIGYPLENYLYQLTREVIEKVINELLDLDQEETQDPFSYPNFAAFLKGNFGDTLYHLYFKPYNEKIWQTDLETVPMRWLEGKLPMPNYRQVLLSNILQKEESEMVHSTFFYAKKGGSQFIIDRLSQGLNIKTNDAVHQIEHKNNQWIINNRDQYDKVIYTGDIRQLHKMIKIDDVPDNPDQITNKHINESTNNLKNLHSNGTSNLLCTTDPTDISWLYLPDPNLKCHRIIYTGNFSPNNNAPDNRPTCVVEFSGHVSEEVMHAEIKKLPGNLKPLQSNHESNSYVIQDPDTRQNIAVLKELLSPIGFHLLGRFAEWEYYNMDKCMEAAMKLTNNILAKEIY